jgi:hypothetical protein
MQEAFLHYIWKTRSFDHSQLITSDGRPITIMTPGTHNDDAGPDFLEARVKIGDMVWSGAVEMHIKSSNWLQHRHSEDPAYENVILHVVWDHDQEISYPEGQPIPSLPLAPHVDPSLLDRYVTLMHQMGELPCNYAISDISDITCKTMLEKSAIERLETKANEINDLLRSQNHDWEEVCYRLILAAYGMKVNKTPMIRLSETLPFKWIKKHSDQPTIVEALLFGQAGLLFEAKDQYVDSLIQHYEFYAHKYNLSTSLQRPQWKFSRLRPANFPTLRLAQVAAFLAQNPSIFDRIIHEDQYAGIIRLFEAPVSDYWQLHFDLGKPSSHKINKPGRTMIHHVMINVFAPVLVAAGKYLDKHDLIDKAMAWLEQVPAESNKITRKFEAIGIKPIHALDSQGCLSLYYDYCLKKNCLQCNIGASILRR